MITEKQAAERRLQAFITRRLSEERATIAPELAEFVVGNSEDEVEAAITLAKSKTQSGLAGIRQAQARRDDFDTEWASANVREGVANQVPECVEPLHGRVCEDPRGQVIGQRQDAGSRAACVIELQPSDKHRVINDVESWLTRELDVVLLGDMVSVTHKSASGKILDSIEFRVSVPVTATSPA